MIPIKPESSLFTDSQWQAIYEDGSNLLVSASAGSGKTTVLVERVIEKIKNGVSVDELLIVTFTESAAKEMKERIEEALKKRLQQETGENRQYFLRQLSLLPLADISTLHAFCLRVIQRYYYLIGLDPKFRLLTDATENLLLQEDVWQDLREDFYQQADFRQLADNFSSDRNDVALEEMIFALADFAKSSPQPKAWLENLPKGYEIPAVKTLIQEKIIPLTLDLFQEFTQQFKELALDAQQQGLEKTEKVLKEDTEKLANLVHLLQAGNLKAFYESYLSVPFPRFAGYSGKDQELKAFSGELKAQRDSLKKKIEAAFQQILPEDPEVMMALIPATKNIVTTLVETTLAFIEAFTARKRKMNVLDFNDLEHLALQILEAQDPITGEKIAKDFYQEKFQEVMVDEYQDINQLQDAILKSVGKGHNQFMVGDVKQSIYAFRLAEPSLFVDKYYAYEKNDPKIGQRILLQENFRSRKEVLNFTNLLFFQLMDERLGQLTYDEHAALKLGKQTFPESRDFSPELLLYQKENSDTEEDLTFFEDKTDGELTLVAKKIQQLITEKFPIRDKFTGENRPITYGDIVLLAPTKKNNLTLLKTFKRFNIPVVMNDAENYFQATEVKIMLAMLKVIDNPLQDIPLVAVLRSAMVGLNEEELGEIRGVNLQDDFYTALTEFKEDKNPQLFTKIQDFLNLLTDFRGQKNQLSLSQLIFYIYEKTAYLDYVFGLLEGPQRKENLLALAKRARQYEEMNYRGLFQFIRFIEKMQEKKKDLTEPTLLATEDAVRLMTIHGSKGLEFPVVFILDMTKRFNLQDLTGKMILDKNLGIGIKYLDDNRVLHQTFPYLAVAQEKRRLLLSEELRKLYVALTRAEQKLYLVGSYKSEEELLKKWQRASLQNQLVLSLPLRLENSSMMDWVGYSLIRHPQMQSYLAGENAVTLPELAEYGDFSYRFFPVGELQEALPEEIPPVQLNLTADPQLKVEALKILKATYPHLPATETASYQSVTEIKQVFADPDEKTLQSFDEIAPKKVGRYEEAHFPEATFFNETLSVTPQAVGSATHLLLQLISLNKKPSPEDFKTLAEDLVAKGLLLSEITARISYEKLASFFETSLGKEILVHEETLKREQPFSMLLAANELFQEVTTPDDILIHGIVDGLYEKEAGFVLYDFKTDAVKHLPFEKRQELLKTRYQGQLNLYALAIEEATGKKVIEKYLVALATNDVFVL